MGTPPACRPECTISSECSFDKACVNQKCVDPCPGSCGQNTICQVRNHAPICSCNNGYTGDPFSRCYPIPRELSVRNNVVFFNQFMNSTIAPPTIVQQQSIREPCLPSPCGPNSQCRNINGHSSCSCLVNYFGVPPNCRPECTTNTECLPSLACINNRCLDPCPGSCAYNAQCTVRNHIPTCVCPEGYGGDAFTSCQLLPPRKFQNNLRSFYSVLCIFYYQPSHL